MSEKKKVYDKQEMVRTLENINFWISNCDTKISFALAFAGVIVGLFFANKEIANIIPIISSLNLQSFLIIIITLLSIAFLFCLILAIVFFFKGLKGKLDSSEYKQKGMAKKSILYFGTIEMMDFNEFKEETQLLSEEKLDNDYLSQIHINATICKAKFKNYNKGVNCLIFSVILFILFNVLMLFV
jgi:hypothetical protein